MNRSEEELHHDLAHGADVFEARGGRERTMSEVLGTARSIRRRRRAGTALVAAAVLAAVAVPVGLAVGHQSATAPPPATTNTPTPRPVERIGLGDLPVGRTPATGWVVAGTWHAPDGTVVKAPARIGEVRGAARSQGGVVVATTDSDGVAEAWFLHDDGRVDDLGGMESTALARSPEGHVIAFAGSGGRPVVVQDSEDPRQLAPVSGSALQAVAVTGEACTATGPGCVVWLNDAGPTPGVLPVASGAAVDLAMVPRIETLADVAADGRLAGIVSRTDTGTCSEVQDGGGHKVWGTCDARFVAFSPDGTRLLGTSADGDGAGDARLTVLEAATGRVELDLRTARGAVITQMIWEDDSHVLAAVTEGQRAALVRIDVDGGAEYAVPPMPSGDVSPFVLPAS